MKQKGTIKKIYTSLRYRMISISVSVVVFLAVMIVAILIELHNNQERYMAMYERDQQQITDQVAVTLRMLCEQGQTEEQMISYISEQLPASASRFFVLAKDDEILFAKNTITTKCLGSKSDKQKFYQSIEEQNTITVATSFTGNGASYEIAVVSDAETVKGDGGLYQHYYYILLGTVILGLVLVSLLVTLLGYWNRTEKKLQGTEKELDLRNEKMEQISQETGTLVGDKTDFLTKEEVTGIIKTEKVEFYNIYTIRMLLHKSEEADLKPLQILLLRVVMGNQYYTKDQLFDAMGQIQKQLRKVEVMGEVKRGQFVILLYRTPIDRAKERLQQVEQVCKDILREKGIRIECELIPEDDRNALERFEAGLEETL